METFFNYHKKNQSENFVQTDTAKKFHKNKKKQPNDWIYHNKTVEYKTNNQGFRCRPFDEFDWENSIVVLGCSNVFGIGLAEEDCLTSLIETNLGVQTINLGIPGSAIDLACANSYLVHKNLPHPKAVIQIWTSLYRYTEFYPKAGVGPRYPKGRRYMMNHWECRNQLYMDIDRHLWTSSDSAYIECTFFGDTQFSSNTYKLETIDTARDLMHPGIESNTQAADFCSKKLKEEIEF